MHAFGPENVKRQYAAAGKFSISQQIRFQGQKSHFQSKALAQKARNFFSSINILWSDPK
jgi:acyl-ACP thioesterase